MSRWGWTAPDGREFVVYAARRDVARHRLGRFLGHAIDGPIRALPPVESESDAEVMDERKAPGAWKRDEARAAHRELRHEKQAAERMDPIIRPVSAYTETDDGERVPMAERFSASARREVFAEAIRALGPLVDCAPIGDARQGAIAEMFVKLRALGEKP